MDFQKILLVAIFSLSSLMLLESWQAYQHSENTIKVSEEQNLSLPSKNIPTNASEPKKIVKPLQGKPITVKTDTLQVDIDSIGGSIKKIVLSKHSGVEDKHSPFVLLNESQSQIYVAQSGLLGSNLPNHNTEYQIEKQSYELADGENKLVVDLLWTDSSIKVVKSYVFHRNSYLIDVVYKIENLGNSTIDSSAYYQLVRDGNPPAGDSKLLPTYTGPAIYTNGEKFKKLDFKSINEGKTAPLQAKDGWIAMLQHYFVAAWLPQEGQSREFYTKKIDDNVYAAGVVIPLTEIKPQETIQTRISLYAGPAHANLDEVAPGLGLTVDYGWLTVIASPLFSLLAFIHAGVNNWGIAIIILTILIKLLFFPLSAASYRSMAKMRVIAPKLEKIKEQYGNDREKLNRAMMDLYKTEKINPLGGCLPILIQIPVFIALYWAILSSVELRNAPFFGWINDLSAIDPYYILPLIMGISMWVQSKLNPTPTDPLQAKLMQIMPIIFSIVFFFFPAGLVLYSIVNNLLSIAQQWYITHKLEVEQKTNRA